MRDPQQQQQQQDIVRVLRLIEYVGPRDAVERQVASSLHGTVVGAGLSGYENDRRVATPQTHGAAYATRVVITAGSLHEFAQLTDERTTLLVQQLEALTTRVRELTVEVARRADPLFGHGCNEGCRPPHAHMSEGVLRAMTEYLHEHGSSCSTSCGVTSADATFITPQYIEVPIALSREDLNVINDPLGGSEAPTPKENPE